MNKLQVFRTACAVLLLGFSVSASAGMVYKCKNSQGGLSYQEEPCKEAVESVSSWAAAESPQYGDAAIEENIDGTLVIKQQGNGHYFLSGAINGRPLTFIVDTGATFVALPRALASAAGIFCRDKILMQTANGTASACTAIIPRLKFGSFFIKDAKATISPNLQQPLLGMSVLQQFKIEQENGEMRISTRN